MPLPGQRVGSGHRGPCHPRHESGGTTSEAKWWGERSERPSIHVTLSRGNRCFQPHKRHRQLCPGPSTCSHQDGLQQRNLCEGIRPRPGRSPRLWSTSRLPATQPQRRIQGSRLIERRTGHTTPAAHKRLNINTLNILTPFRKAGVYTINAL